VRIALEGFLQMTLFKILRFSARAIFVMALLFVLWIVGLVWLKHMQAEERLAQCVWEPVAQVKLGEEILFFPALKHTNIYFRYRHNTPSGSPLASAVLNEPWDDVPLGFCDADLTGSPDSVVIRLDRAALIPLLADIGFTEENDLKSVTLRNWVTIPAKIEVIAGPEDVFIHDPSLPKNAQNQPLERLRTSGWVNGTHAVITSCMDAREPAGKFYCSYDILRKEDAVEVSLTGILVDYLPQAGQRNPALLDDLLAKFDAVLAHYASPTPHLE